MSKNVAFVFLSSTLFILYNNLELYLLCPWAMPIASDPLTPPRHCPRCYRKVNCQMMKLGRCPLSMRIRFQEVFSFAQKVFVVESSLGLFYLVILPFVLPNLNMNPS